MFDFRKVNVVADILAKMDGEEFSSSAISRYYYALFCCARLYLIFVMNETQFIKGKEIHREVCNRLISSNDPTEVSLGAKLDELRELRNKADYNWDENSSFFERRLNFACKESKKGLEQVQALKTSPPYRL